MTIVCNELEKKAVCASVLSKNIDPQAESLAAVIMGISEPPFDSTHLPSLMYCNVLHGPYRRVRS